MALRDVLTSRPRILFVGINPGLRSEALGHHFAGPGNPFWRLLRAAELVPEPLTSADDRRREEFELGKRVLERKIGRLQPELVAFVGVTLYARFFGSARRGKPG